MALRNRQKVILSMAPASFKTILQNKNCRRHRNLNSNCLSRRRTRWPLDHYHSLKAKKVFMQAFRYDIQCDQMLVLKSCPNVSKSCLNNIHSSFTLIDLCQSRPKVNNLLGLPLVSEFVAKNFQKSPNLATLIGGWVGTEVSSKTRDSPVPDELQRSNRFRRKIEKNENVSATPPEFAIKSHFWRRWKITNNGNSSYLCTFPEFKGS